MVAPRSDGGGKRRVTSKGPRERNEKKRVDGVREIVVVIIVVS